MPIIIGEITSEVVMDPESSREGPGGSRKEGLEGDSEASEQLIRLVTEEVLARLRLEWSR